MKTLQPTIDTLPWLFVDVDSTLILPGTKISDRNRQALMDYVSIGGRVSLATGKHPLAIMSLIEEMGLLGPHVAGNGSIIVKDGKSELIAGIGDYVQALDALLRREHIPFSIYTSSGVFVSSDDVTDSHIKLLLDIDEPVPDRINSPDWDNAFKILMFVPDSEVELESILRTAAADFKVASVRTSRDFLEMISPYGGKSVAMEKVLNSAGWSLRCTAAVGDSENDLCMLQKVGIAAVMGNASDCVKSAADKVLPACEEDGVAVFVEGLLTDFRGS